MPTHASSLPPTPECELRTLHKFLERFRTEDFQSRVAAELIAYPDRLDDMLRRSLEQTKPFKSVDAWHEGRGDSGASPEMEQSTTWANQLVMSLRAEQSIWPGNGLTFKYVDYEIVPFRETGDSGRLRPALPEPTAGRFDMLASNMGEKHPAPVIVEIKAATDGATTLRTLIQILTYAVEMGTPHQRDRLNSVYGDTFGTHAEQPWLDLCVMKELPENLSPKAKSNSDERHALVQELCEQLMKQPATSGLIRRIAWLHPRRLESGRTSFDQRFLCTND